MSVVFLILKIAGILLLVILGLLLLLILSILLIPVRYRIRGRAQDTVEGMIRISWFLHIVSVLGEYKENGFQIKVRIFGIPLRIGDMESDGEERKPKKNKKKKSKKEKHKEKKRKKEKQKKADREPPGVIQNDPSMNGDTKEQVLNNKDLEGGDMELPALNLEDLEGGNMELPSVQKQQDKKTDTGSRKGTRHRKKRKGIFSGLKQRITSLIKTLQELPKKIKVLLLNITQTKERIKNIISEEANKSAFMMFWREICFLIRHFSPRKVKGEISYGTGSPDLTGQILGGLSAIPFFYRWNILILPDFETETWYVKGFFEMKGHARGVHLLRMGIRLLMDKNFRSLIRQFKTQ